MSAITLLRFNERTAVQPSDELGNLDDLATEQPTFVAAATSVTARSTTITLATPAGVLPGDTLLMFAFSANVAESDLTTSSLPSGWSLLSRLDTSSRLVALSRRTVVAGEPANHVFPMTSTGSGSPLLGVIVAYRGLDASSTLVAASSINVTSGTAFPCPSLTLTSSTDLYLGWAPSNNNTASSTPPAGAVERVDQGAAQSGFNRAVLFEIKRGVAGATGTQTATASLTVSGVAAAFAIRVRAVPARVSAWTGYGRQFSQLSTRGFIAGDKSTAGTLLQRDVTIQALLSLTLTGASGPMTVLARGTNDGTISERYAYGLELEQQSGFPGFVEVRWFWQDDAGAIKTAPAGVFQHLGDGKEFMLTATRRWESTSRVVVRYYVHDELIAELVSTDGSISGGTTGRTTVGARKSAGAYDRFCSGVIDDLMVLDEELSLEEIRHTWKRLTEYQPGAVETLAGETPPGSSWARPGTLIGRRVKIAGQLHGRAVAAIEEIRALALPDTAPSGHHARWERITGQSAQPGDSLDVRHARVGSFLARDEGFHLSAIRQALTGPMDLEADQIEIDEYTNTYEDGFATTIGPQWFNGGGATYSIVSGQLQAFAAAGVNLRWQDRKTPFLLHSAEPGRVFVQAMLTTVNDANDIANLGFAGIALHNRHTLDWLWFGVRNSGGDLEVVYRTAVAGGAPSAFTVVATPGTDGPFWLRIASDQSPDFVDDGELTVSFSTTGPSAGFTDTVINTGVSSGWHWAGFALNSDTASPATSTTVRCDDFVLHCFDGVRPFYWQAFRNPALPGNPDMTGADRLVNAVAPAYTIPSAIMNRSCPCDDARDGLCDVNPTV